MGKWEETCPKCLSVYQVQTHKVSGREAGEERCHCGHVLAKWDREKSQPGKVVHVSYSLKKRGANA